MSSEVGSQWFEMKCKKCKGVGRIKKSWFSKWVKMCPVCHGRGFVRKPRKQGN